MGRNAPTESTGGGAFPLTAGTAPDDAFLQCYYGEATSFVTSSVSANRIFISPLWVPKKTVIDGLWFINDGTGDSGDDVRMGLFSSTNGLPGALIDETGEIALDATRDVRVAAMAADQTLEIDTVYWVGIVANAAISVTAESYAAVRPNLTRIGLPVITAGFSPWNGSNYRNGLYKNHTYGAMPDPFGTPSEATINPLMGVRVKVA